MRTTQPNTLGAASLAGKSGIKEKGQPRNTLADNIYGGRPVNSNIPLSNLDTKKPVTPKTQNVNVKAIDNTMSPSAKKGQVAKPGDKGIIRPNTDIEKLKANTQKAVKDSKQSSLKKPVTKPVQPTTNVPTKKFVKGDGQQKPEFIPVGYKEKKGLLPDAENLKEKATRQEKEKM